MSPKLVRTTPAPQSLIATTAAPLLEAKVDGIAIPGAAAVSHAAAIPEQGAVGQSDGPASVVPANPIGDADLEGLTDEQQLRRLEESMARAQASHDAGSLAVKARYVIEMGTALRYVQVRKLHTVAGFDTFEDYITAAEIGVRSRAYQLMDSAQAMTKVIVSKILDKVPNESQAVFLAPLLENHKHDEVKAVVERIEGEGKKPTVANLKAAAIELKLIPKPEKAKPAGKKDRTSTEAAPDPIRDWRVALKGLQSAYVALAPATQSAAREADAQAAEALLGEMKKSASGILRRIEQAAEAN
ncbi:hypothetical protein ACFC26_28165 [Kitasatospora purpeofusca]|uniref:hypothetical protein n=1 Tax=Kitasatospora purpeofusca TaxID=67352 RepID=UPI0035D9DFF1